MNASTSPAPLSTEAYDKEPNRIRVVRNIHTRHWHAAVQDSHERTGYGQGATYELAIASAHTEFLRYIKNNPR